MNLSSEELRLLHVCDQNLALARAHLEWITGQAFDGDSRPLIIRLAETNDRIVDRLEQLRGKDIGLEMAIDRAIELAGVATLIAGLIELSGKK